ncbi:hypothetical protein KM043_017753 [Ampulex compressa]|nr:hypothetical protein KM043_017753 [Ampulex compressa]
MSYYIITGKPVWDVKLAQGLSRGGDILVAPSSWQWANPHEYTYETLPDEIHTLILACSSTWYNSRGNDITNNVEEDETEVRSLRSRTSPMSIHSTLISDTQASTALTNLTGHSLQEEDMKQIDYSLRPKVIKVAKAHLKDALRSYMLRPVIRSVEMDEPLAYLTEMRQVVIVFVNVIISTVTRKRLITLTNSSYKLVCGIVGEMQGCVNKTSLFDKDLMFLCIFGLRGDKHELESQIGLRCAATLQTKLAIIKGVESVTVGVTTGMTYCGVVGHILRREYTVIGMTVNKAARLMCAYKNKAPYSLIHLIFSMPLGFTINSTQKEREDELISRLGKIRQPHFLCALNQPFNVHFTMSSKYKALTEVEKHKLLRKFLLKLMRCCFDKLWVIIIDDAEYGDDESLQLFDTMAKGDTVFFVLSIGQKLSAEYRLHPAILNRAQDSVMSLQSVENTLDKSDLELEDDDATISVCTITDNFSLEDVEAEMTMDVMILKLFDSLTPLDQLLLKCAAVLGEIINRRMLESLMDATSKREIGLGSNNMILTGILEFVEICLMNYNIPQARRLLDEGEAIVQQGKCHLESGVITEAEMSLRKALKSLGCRFPNTDFMINMQSLIELEKLKFRLTCLKNWKIETETEYAINYKQQVADCLAYMFDVFRVCLSTKTFK